jgi:ribosomal protein S18 acetylase RimI-like enzyme
MTEFTLAWDKSTQTLPEAARFAAAIISAHDGYISHGEIQTGLSPDGKSWADNVDALFDDDFQDFGDDRDLLVARSPEGRIIGIAIVAWEQSTRRSFAVLEDMAVDPTVRSSGLGHALITEIENAVRARNVDWIFLESGKNNLRAHGFFERNGFAEISHVFGKKL